MMDGHHYTVNFVTFYQILGFGHVHRTYSQIHNKRRLEPQEVSFMWEDPDKADGRRTGLKRFYYIMNNHIRSTLNPKDNATDLNGYITNVLSRFLNGEKFNVSRFMWVELGFTMDDGRRDLPYSPCLMFLIERVIGLRYSKDGFHQAYKIKKTWGGAAPTHRMGSSFSHEDLPEGSHSRSRRSDLGRGRLVHG
jgi:hypothetical protein